jgi:O-antigen/teichoic acid export membrane protein
MIAILSFSLIFKSSDVFKYWFESQIQSRYVVWVENFVFLIVSAIKVVMILSHAPLIAFVWIMLVESILVAIGLIGIYLKREGGVGKWTIQIQRAKTLLKDSWPLIFSGFVLMVQARIDQIMLGEMVGDTEVGYYSASLRIVETVAFIPIILRSSLFPTITKAKTISENLYQNRLLDFYRLNFITAIFIGIPIFIFSEQIVTILFGDAYQPAGILLALMSTRLFFAHMGVARGVYLLLENMLRYSLVTMILGTITNITLNYYLIREYASLGAVIATIVSFFVTIFLIDIFYRNTKSNSYLMLRSLFSIHKLYKLGK